jgi:hypothetical protein
VSVHKKNNVSHKYASTIPIFMLPTKGHSLQSHAATSSFSISRPIENLLFAVRLETSAHLPTAQAIHSSSSPPCRKVVWSHQFMGPRVSGSVSFPPHASCFLFTRAPGVNFFLSRHMPLFFVLYPSKTTSPPVPYPLHTLSSSVHLLHPENLCLRHRL